MYHDAYIYVLHAFFYKDFILIIILDIIFRRIISESLVQMRMMSMQIRLLILLLVPISSIALRLMPEQCL